MKWTWIQAAVAALCILLVIPPFLQERPSKTDFDTIEEAVTKGIDRLKYPLQDDQGIQQYLGLSPDQYDQAVLYRSDDRLHAEELFLVKFEPDQQEALVEALEKRIETQTNTFGTYLPKEKQMASEAILSVHPNYILYVAGENAAQMEAVFEDTL